MQIRTGNRKARLATFGQKDVALRFDGLGRGPGAPILGASLDLDPGSFFAAHDYVLGKHHARMEGS